MQAGDLEPIERASQDELQALQTKTEERQAKGRSTNTSKQKRVVGDIW
jgi:hypothetical protein